MISNPGTLGESIEIVSTILSEAGIENSRREAHLLLQYVTGKSVTDLRGFPKARLYADVWNKVLLLTKRRAQHEPMAYLMKNKEFWSLPFEVTEDTLIPRPE
jgi:release factor glutamine methyltransferase